MADVGVASLPAAAADLPVTDHGATGDRIQAKPSTSKKRAGAKPRKTSGSAQLGEHPKYSVMIADAITKLKERGGSSRQAILKFILAHYKVGSELNKVNARVKVSLKSGVKTGSLKQSKGTGAAGSFRLGDKKSAENKPRSKITKTKKPAGPVRKSPSKKTKAAVRKPKLAKSPKKTAAKKAKAKSPAKKLKIGAKKVKAAAKSKPKSKSPAKRTSKPKKAAKKAGAKK